MSNEHNIQEHVLHKIHAGQVSMRSRAYFIFRTILIGVAAMLVLAASLFALSFVFFSVHESGTQYLLEFSERGIMTFVMLFPWTSFFLFLLLVIALEMLVRRFAPVYRAPLLRTFLWLIVIGIVGSILIGFTPLHSFLLSEADKDQLPFLGSWYEQIHDTHQDQGVYRGDVATTTSTYFIITHNDTDRDSDDGTWHVIPPAGFDLSTIVAGEKVYIAGQLMNGIVYAYGIHPVTDHE